MAQSRITILSTNEEIRKYVSGFKDEEIGEAMCSLIEDNNYSNEVLELDEDFYDGY